MFNKPNLFNRNESEQRRDASSARGITGKVPPFADVNTNRSPAPAKPLMDPSAAKPMAPAASPESPAATEANRTVGTLPGGDSIMGARLIVGPEVKLKGAEILDCDTLVVEGRVEATMDSRVVRIAEHGAFIGKVSIDIAEIHGVFEGELTARSQLIIHATGRVSGKIRYGKLVADEGCELCGDINVLAESVVPGKVRPMAEPLIAVS